MVPRAPVVGRGLQQLAPVRTEDRSRGWVADRQPAVLQQIEPGLLILAAGPERTQRVCRHSAGRDLERAPPGLGGEQVCGALQASSSPSALPARPAGRVSRPPRSRPLGPSPMSRAPARGRPRAGRTPRPTPRSRRRAAEGARAAYVPGPPGSRCTRRRPGQPLLPPPSARTGAPLEELAADESVGGRLDEPTAVAVERGDPAALVAGDVHEEVGRPAEPRRIALVAARGCGKSISLRCSA